MVRRPPRPLNPARARSQPQATDPTPAKLREFQDFLQVIALRIDRQSPGLALRQFLRQTALRLFRAPRPEVLFDGWKAPHQSEQLTWQVDLVRSVRRTSRGQRLSVAHALNVRDGPPPRISVRGNRRALPSAAQRTPRGRRLRRRQIAFAPAGRARTPMRDAIRRRRRTGRLRGWQAARSHHVTRNDESRSESPGDMMRPNDAQHAR